MKINEELEKSRNLIFIAIVLIFTMAFYKTAWVAEDAFITFRVINNALEGLGLVWNSGERVQVYTHPLWFFILLPLTGLFGDPFYVVLSLSYIFLVLTLYFSYRALKNHRWWALISICSLLWSRSFVDYSSSGLENSLLHLLTVLFLWMWIERKDAGLASLLISLLFLTRPDAVVLFLPAFLFLCFQDRRRGRIFIGLIPIFFWIIFSLFYYGSPVPNTALAKVGTGLAIQDRFIQAIYYFQWTYENDKVTLIILVFGIISGLLDKRFFVFSLGILLFIAYLFYVGADYMGGRFLSMPTLLSALLFSCVAGRVLVSLLMSYLLLSFNSLMLTVFSPPNFNQAVIENGIADERGFYYQWLGLSPSLRQGGWTLHPWFQAGLVLPGLYTRCAIGMAGFASEKTVRWIDPMALAEPFLARLPAKSKSRIGHHERALPAGYLESMVSGENKIVDKALSDLYADVDMVVRKPLFAKGRFKAVWRLNAGYYKEIFDNFDREAIGLPGVPISDKSPLSCYGVSSGWNYTWQIVGVPATAVSVNR